MDTTNLLLILATFLVAGMVKGVIGLGLPTVGLAVLTATLGLPQAMALVLVPAFLTNVWQAATGGHFVATLRRIWPFLLTAMVTVRIGALALTRVDLTLLSALLGVSLIVYAIISLAGVRMVVPAKHELLIGTVLGAVNGVLTGMTGAFAVPGVMFLQAIGLPRDRLVQAMGMLFLASTIALAISLGDSDLLSPQLGLLSGVAIIPAIAGMFGGQLIRKRLSEAAFRKGFFVALLALGLYIVATALIEHF